MPAQRSRTVQKCKSTRFDIQRRERNDLVIGFEPVEGNPNHVKCLPCSEAYSRTKDITKNSISSHCKSTAHTVALECGGIISSRRTDMLDVTMTALQSSL